MTQWAGMVRRLPRGQWTVVLRDGVIDTAAQAPKAYIKVPFDCDIVEVHSHCDVDPDADSTVTVKNGAGGTTVATTTHATIGFSAPDAQQDTTLANVSLEEGDVLEIGADGATTAGGVNITVTVVYERQE